jgi:signal transduction histidine kinase
MNLAPLALLLLFLVACLLWWRERSLARRLLRERGAIRSELESSFAEREALSRECAAAEERERIHARLHDDIRARLLRLIHSSPPAPQAGLARSILQDLRDVVSGAHGEPATLLEALSAIRGEAAQQLTLRGGALDWKQADELPDLQLDHGQARQLLRILREAVRKAVQHAPACRLCIRAACYGDELLLDITDDDRAELPPDDRGSDKLRQHAAVLGGGKVQLRIPLPPAAAD